MTVVQAENRNERADTPVIGFAGWSGSGKTTLLVKLIPALKEAAREKRRDPFHIGIVKHDAHGIRLIPIGLDVETPDEDQLNVGQPGEETSNIKQSDKGTPDEERSDAGANKVKRKRLFRDTPGKDSWKFRQSGADRVVLCGPEGMFVSENSGEQREEYYLKRIEQEEQAPGGKAARQDTILQRALGILQDMDLILVEGCKQADLLQIGVARKETGRGLTAAPDHFFAIVTDDPVIRESIESRSRTAEESVFGIGGASGVAERQGADPIPVFAFDQTRELAEYILRKPAGNKDPETAGSLGQL